jgi:hypothetical protein
MDTNKNRSRILRFITISPWIALVVGVIVIVFYQYAGSSPLSCLTMCVFGAALSPVVAKLYKTGQVRYALLYGALFGIGMAVFDRMELAGTNPIVTSIYAGICTVFGVSVVFAFFRQRLLQYLSLSDVQPST